MQPPFPPRPRPRRPWLRVLVAAVLLVGLVIAVYGSVLANQAGLLPWQEEPTRVATGITPFAGLDVPGFGAPTPTPAAAE